MTAEDDLRQLIALAQRAVAAAHDGAGFSAVYKIHWDCYEMIGQRCRDDLAYRTDHRAAAALLLPHYRSGPAG